MTTETTTLHIRRAHPLDAVNVYRLLVDEEKRAGVADDPKQTASRIAYLLDVIDGGYATVAVVSGRIVGSIGAVEMNSALTGAFFALSPSFHDTNVGSRLLAGLLRFAEKQTLPFRFPLLLPIPKHVQRVFEEAAGGFVAVAMTYEWTPNNGVQKEQEETAAPEAP